MSANDSGTDRLASSLHRSILGILLAIAGLVGLAYAARLPSGEFLTGTVGAVVALGAAYWIVSLFAEGLRER